MSSSGKQHPQTLGQKLMPVAAARVPMRFSDWLRYGCLLVFAGLLLVGMATLPLWWFLQRPDLGGELVLAIWVGMVVLWLLANSRRRAVNPRKMNPRAPLPALLANDRQGFMSALRLDAKTAIIDGSNIYHFGHDNGVDAQPLGLIAEQMRREGYRVVCFFDANIFYTMRDHGAFSSRQKHTMDLLEEIFGLAQNEIYVVPSGTQADKYVLDSLKHLPLSFAITNDRFRDYAKAYPTVMKGNQWRKGVVISKNELKLLQHRFQQPVYLN